MTRSQSVLLSQQACNGAPRPSPATVKIRADGRLVPFRFQVGPCGAPPRGRKARLRQELGGVELSQMILRLDRLLKDKQDLPYFSQHKLPAAAKPLWAWVRDVRRFRTALAKPTDLLQWSFDKRLPRHYARWASDALNALKIQPRGPYGAMPHPDFRWVPAETPGGAPIRVLVFDEPDLLDASAAANYWEPGLRLTLPRNWGALRAHGRSLWWHWHDGWWLRLHRVGTAEILWGPFQPGQPLPEELHTCIREVPHDRGSET